MINCDKILEERKNIFNLEQFTLVQKSHSPGKNKNNYSFLIRQYKKRKLNKI